MDLRIKDLTLRIFDGQRFIGELIGMIQYTVSIFSALSRRELAYAICKHLSWNTPNGGNKIHLCFAMLERMEEFGMVSLLEKDASKKRGPQRKIP